VKKAKAEAKKGYKLQVTGYRLQGTGYKLQGTGCKLQGTVCRITRLQILRGWVAKWRPLKGV